MVGPKTRILWGVLATVLFGAGFAVLAFGPKAFAEIAAPRNDDSWSFGLGMIWVMLLLGVIIAAIVSLFSLASRRRRRGAAVTLLLLACFVGSNFAATRAVLSVYSDARTGHFERLAQRSKPLVDAISGFERKHGRPPWLLEELVPDYLEAVPKTGIDIYPHYKYFTYPKYESNLKRVWYDLGPSSWLEWIGVDPTRPQLLFRLYGDRTVVDYWAEGLPDIVKQTKFEAKRWSTAGRQRQSMVDDLLLGRLPEKARSFAEIKDLLGDPDGVRIERAGRWELRVPCSPGALEWDTFFYWPGGNYPDEIYGGGVQRIGDWAYVHE